MSLDNTDLFRLFVIVIAIFGAINALTWIRRSADDPITLGPLTMSKARWTRFVLLWNGIGIPILALLLFLVWRP
jgi:hypothetical protein